jgi:hypothetical protein
MKLPRFTKRLLRIAIGLAVGAIIGWTLGGLFNGEGLGETQALAHDITPLSAPSPQSQLIPDSAPQWAQVKWIAGHLLAGIALIFFSGLVVGLLSGENAKEPMEEAATNDAQHH